MRAAFLLLFMAAAFVIGSVHVSAATFTVNSFIDAPDTTTSDNQCLNTSLNQCTLRAAIMQANAQPGADTIILPAGTYTLMLAGMDEDESLSGDLDINSDITIIGSNGNREGNASGTVIDGGKIDRVFDLNANLDYTGFTITLEALTIRNGEAGGNYYSYGGGIRADTGNAGTITLYNSIVENNASTRTTGAQGGGVYVSGFKGGSFLSSKSVIRGNQAGEKGGGLYVEGDMNVTVSETDISNNKVTSTVLNNWYGGGMAFVTATINARTIVIERTTISGNQVMNGYGGGLYTSAPATVENTTISGNTATQQGAGAYVDNNFGAALWKSNTISNNTTSAAGTGGGLYLNHNPSFTMHNTIVAGNRQGSSPSDLDSSGALLIASSFNLIGTGGSLNLENGSNGNLTGVADAGLLPLADNGGRTQTHGLKINSPALDAGNNAHAGAMDQRGINRIADSADSNETATVDIGAVETYPVLEDLPNQSVVSGSALDVPFNIGDAAVGNLTISGTSSDQTKVRNSSIAVTGTGDRER
ncbi:hypothetical protein N6H14_20950 [Paenibacillus sp. CC-CFT747]|nr:hypothetical protein N6H14_20950 [Paenibacillus sp. CC-CFT747]